MMPQPGVFWPGRGACENRRRCRSRAGARTVSKQGLFVVNPLGKPVAGVALQTGHLVKCPRCGEMNGRSAEACWKCESDLRAAALSALIKPAPVVVEAPPAPAPAPKPVAAAAAAPARTPAPAPAAQRPPIDLHLDLKLPLLNDPAPDVLWGPGAGMAGMSAAPAARAMPPDLRRLAPWALFAGFVAIVLGLGIGTWLYLERDDEPVVRRPGPALAPARMAPPPAGPHNELSAADAALRNAEALLAQPGPEPEPAPAPPPPQPARARKAPPR